MKLFLSSLAVLFLSIQAAFAEPVKIGLASEPYPPASYQDENGQWTGWEVDLINVLCAEAKLDCEIVPVPWVSIFTDLNAGKVDAIISAIIITEERLKTVDFTNKYCESTTSSAVVASKSSSIDATLESFKGKSIGVQTGTTHANYVDKHFAGIASKIQKFDQQQDAFLSVSKGDIEAVLASTDDANAFLSSEVGEACCEYRGIVEPDPLVFGDGLGIGIRKDATKLKSKLNAAIQTVKAQDRLRTILQPHTDPDSCD
jgi:polar amino acid transport system substrate-binding protein